MDQSRQGEGPDFVPDSMQDNKFVQLFTEGPGRILVALIVPVIGFVLLWQSFLFMRDSEASRFAIGVVAILVGVFGVWFLYIATNFFVEQLPDRARDALRPFVFVGPALAVLAFYLLYPALETLRLSLFGSDSENFVGLDNYITVIESPEFRQIIGNNILWIIFVTAGTVGVGLLVAVMVDRIGRWEPVAKSLIFLPMAISSVGASVIWKFVYDARTVEGESQIGLLNAVRVSVFNMDTIDFVRETPINNFALMFIMFWMLTGFCMVILSSAVKGVPNELLEAARIDGAGEVRIFFSVTIPVIWPTIFTVTTTVLILVLKQFDIPYVFGARQFDADLLANRMFFELFRFDNIGIGSTLAMVLLIAVLPMIFWNVYELRRENR